jgi:hypothetical protein
VQKCAVHCRKDITSSVGCSPATRAIQGESHRKVNYEFRGNVKSAQLKLAAATPKETAR